MGAWLPRRGLSSLWDVSTHPTPTPQGGWPSVSPFSSSREPGQPRGEWFSHAPVGTVHSGDCGSIWSVASLSPAPPNSFHRRFSNSATCHAPSSPKPAMLGLWRRGQQVTPSKFGDHEEAGLLRIPPFIPAAFAGWLAFKKTPLSPWPMERMSTEAPPGLLRTGRTGERPACCRREGDEPSSKAAEVSKLFLPPNVTALKPRIPTFSQKALFPNTRFLLGKMLLINASCSLPSQRPCYIKQGTKPQEPEGRMCLGSSLAPWFPINFESNEAYESFSHELAA